MTTINSQELSQEKLKAFEKEKFAYQQRLSEKLDSLDGDFNENIINEIVLWKVNRAPYIDSEILALINQIPKNAYEINLELTSEILERLLNSPGFDLPMASTLLRFKNPNIYQIIDQRVFRFIYPGIKTLKLTGSVESKIELYLKYLHELKSICLNKNLEFVKIDRTLYLADKELNKNIPLKRYGSKPKKSNRNEHSAGTNFQR